MMTRAIFSQLNFAHDFSTVYLILLVSQYQVYGETVADVAITDTFTTGDVANEAVPEKSTVPATVGV